MQLPFETLTDENRRDLSEFARRLVPHISELTAEWAEAWLQEFPAPGIDPDAYGQVIIFSMENSVGRMFGFLTAGDFEGLYDHIYSVNRQGAREQLRKHAVELYDQRRLHIVARMGNPIVVRWIHRLFAEDPARAVRVELAQERLGGTLATLLSDAYSDEREGSLQAARERLQRALGEAERANEAKSQFVAAVSHEIRSPLNSLLGYVQLMREETFGPVTDEQAATLVRLEAIAHSTLRLTDDLLEHSRIEAGKLPVRIETIPLEPLISELRDTGRLLVEGRALHFHVTVSSDATAVQADPDRLRQILMNLLGNAAKFTTAGSVRLTIARATQTAMIEFSVRDTGAGISAHDLPRIFDLFYRADQSSKVGGAGIGLFLSRELATLMGGQLAAESELGKGSTFTLSLPAA